MHTPGPWFSDGIYIWAPRDERREGTAMVADMPLSFEDDAAHLARIRGVGRGATIEEQKANAALIAAAPELLEALREIREACCSGMGNLPAADVARAQAAIEKAEGRR